MSTCIAFFAVAVIVGVLFVVASSHRLLVGIISIKHHARSSPVVARSFGSRDHHVVGHLFLDRRLRCFVAEDRRSSTNDNRDDCFLLRKGLRWHMPRPFTTDNLEADISF